MAVLAYLDFFPTGVQRVALSTAANICRQIPSDSVDIATDAVPILSNLLNYSDHKLVDRAAICITHIVDSFAKSPASLEKISKHEGLLDNIVGMISTGNERTQQVVLTPTTYTGLVRALSIICGRSARATKKLYELKITYVLREILKGSSSSSISSPASPYSQQSHQLQEVLNLANELLPSVPQTHTKLHELSCQQQRGIGRGASRIRQHLQQQQLQRCTGRSCSPVRALLSLVPGLAWLAASFAHNTRM